MLRKIGLSTAAILAAMALIQAPSALAAGRDDFRARNSYSSGMFPDIAILDIAMMSVIRAAIAPRIATTTATFRKLAAALDCADGSNTTLRNGGDDNRKVFAIVIIMAIAASSNSRKRSAFPWV